MFFHTFDSQEERRAFGGSCFIEIQTCKFPAGTDIDTLVDIDSVEHWELSSLYCGDENAFYEKYVHILGDGIYNNQKSGPVDIYGLNYFPQDRVEAIISRLSEEKTEGYAELLFWLYNHKPVNGIYILGI